MSPANQISTAIALAASYLFAAGCDSSSDMNPDYSASDCYLVLDELTSKALANDSVYVYDVWGSGSRFAGTTDATGSFCFESRKGDYLAFFTIRVDGYVLRGLSTCDSPRCTVRMKAVAFLRIHVKNLPPTASDDRLLVVYPGAYAFFGTVSLDFHGSEIDTLITEHVRPETSSVAWRSWHNSLIVDSTAMTIVTTPRDTTFLEVLY